MRRARRFQSIYAWVIITGVIVGTVIFHIGNPALASFDLLALGLILQNARLLVHPQHPKLASILLTLNAVVLILFFILLLSQRR